MSSLFHPLCGSNLSTLLRLFLTNGGIDRPNWAPATLALAVT
ncbi:MAG: sulfotransferase, partial [Microcystis aeruginosa]